MKKKKRLGARLVESFKAVLKDIKTGGNAIDGTYVVSRVKKPLKVHKLIRIGDSEAQVNRRFRRLWASKKRGCAKQG